MSFWRSLLRDPVTWLALFQIVASIVYLFTHTVWLSFVLVACSAALCARIVRLELRRRREDREFRAWMRRQLNAHRN